MEINMPEACLKANKKTCQNRQCLTWVPPTWKSDIFQLQFTCLSIRILQVARSFKVNSASCYFGITYLAIRLKEVAGSDKSVIISLLHSDLAGNQ
jgi:hypothetical protein